MADLSEVPTSAFTFTCSGTYGPRVLERETTVEIEKSCVFLLRDIASRAKHCRIASGVDSTRPHAVFGERAGLMVH